MGTLVPPLRVSQTHCLTAVKILVEEELEKLAKLIKEEEKKVHNLNSWVKRWARAKRTRRFIAALEREWKRQGIDLSPEGEKGQRVKGSRG